MDEVRRKSDCLLICGLIRPVGGRFFDCNEVRRTCDMRNGKPIYMLFLAPFQTDRGNTIGGTAGRRIET